MTVVILTVKIQGNTYHKVASLAFRLYKILFRLGLRFGPHW